MLKKIFIMFVTITVLVGICGSAYATELKTTLNVIQQASETKYLENDQGYISKNIIDSNADKGEVTIDLGFSNISKDISEENERYDNSEIFIIVNENIANDSEKLNEYISYIETLSKKIFEKNTSTKIGIIGIKGTISDIEIDENGNAIFGENDENTVEGTEENAEIVAKVTNNYEEIKKGLQAMNSEKKEYLNNLQAAIRLANKSYSEKSNKLLIILYDDVPSICIGEKAEINFGAFSIYDTPEEAINAKYKKISAETKNEILKLKANNVDFIMLRPSDTSYDATYYDKNTGKHMMDFDGSQYVREIYGTLENPTYGKMYSLSNDNLEKIVTDYIYKDIVESIREDVKNVKIKEYFSDDIIENFDISFTNKDVDTTKLEKEHYIIWNAGDVSGNKSINLQYTLKIKDMKNEKLLEKVIATSEKTEMQYINKSGNETTIVLTSSPKIQLSEVKEELNFILSYDPTTNTTGKVMATIKANKKVNEVEGWSLSDDGMTLTKEFSINTTETVHLVDIDNMTKDVIVKINNIINKEPAKDNTTATGELPLTGISATIIICLIVTAIISIIIYKKYNSYRDIK